MSERRPRSYAELGIHPKDDNDDPVYMGTGEASDEHVGFIFEFHNHGECEYSWGPHFHGPCKDIWHVPPLSGAFNALTVFCPRREWPGETR